MAGKGMDLAKGHRITATETRLVHVSEQTGWWHVVLRADAGLCGTGEASINPVPADLGPRLISAARVLVGRAVDEATLDPLAILLDGDLVGRSVHAALDQAVWDLRAQFAGQPLCRLLGRQGTSVQLYANINRTTRDRSAAGFADSARRAAGVGHRCLKIAAFDGLRPDLCGTPEGEALIAAGLERLRAVALEGMEVRVDCHWRFTPQAARTLIPALAEIGVTWLECPLPETAETIPELKALRAEANRHGLRTAGLETFGGWAEVRPFVEGGAYDIVMPDVKHAGRLADILDIADKAARHDVAVSLHNPSGPVSHMVSTHVAAALGASERTEYQWNESPLFFEITDPAPRIEAGHALLGDSPGLGVGLTPALQGEGTA